MTATLAAVAAGIADARGWPTPRGLGPAPATIVVAAESAEPETLGLVYEALQPPGMRRSRGSWYTPPGVAAGIASLALAPSGPASGAQVLDPAAGGGAVLLAAARWLVGQGADPERVVAEQLVGVDLDPVAVQVATASLELWSSSQGATAVPWVAVADSLTRVRSSWPSAVARGTATVVVGNPPFGGQLRRVTARSPAVASASARPVRSLGRLHRHRLVVPAGRSGVGGSQWPGRSDPTHVAPRGQGRPPGAATDRRAGPPRAPLVGARARLRGGGGRLRPRHRPILGCSAGRGTSGRGTAGRVHHR